jgi:cellulose synthase/poly-beta-1,6-N-acetylglucosamine synthase-like glycosyltransferase
MAAAKNFHDVEPGIRARDVRPNDECIQLSSGFRCPELQNNALFRVFFIFSCMVQASYLLYRLATFWRTMPSVLMFWAEMPVNFWHMISGMQRWSCRDVRKASPMLKNLGSAFSENAWPEVTVLIPTLDESVETLTGTISSCLRMDYPKHKLWIYVCDDGGRRALQTRCDELSAQFGTSNLVYIARTKVPGVPHHAKAGNLNHALQEVGVHGDFIVCFDADMSPKPEFLQRTIPQFYEYDMTTNTFRDNKIALVQTPQVFNNVPKWDWLDNGQCVWYYSVLCGLDALDSVPFCGTNAVLRRSAIETLPNGGLPYGSLTEDLHTSLQLVLRGWSTRYVNRQLAVGCAPLTLADAIDQRTRWCVGALQMIGIENIWSSNLSFMAKCAFWMLGGLTIYAFRVPLCQMTMLPSLYIDSFRWSWLLCCMQIAMNAT